MPAKKERAKINVVFDTCNVRSGGIGRLSGVRTAPQEYAGPFHGLPIKANGS